MTDNDAFRMALPFNVGMAVLRSLTAPEAQNIPANVQKLLDDNPSMIILLGEEEVALTRGARPAETKIPSTAGEGYIRLADLRKVDYVVIENEKARLAVHITKTGDMVFRKAPF